jgi:hypothetical protein
MSTHPIHPWIDSTHAPVYHLTYRAYDPTDSRQLATYTSEHNALYALLAEWTAARRRAYGFTIDMSHVQSTALTRQRAIQYMEKVRERGSPFMACRAFIVPSEEVRGVLTAVFWHSPPNYPHAFFKTTPEAREWAREQTLALDVQQGRASLASR